MIAAWALTFAALDQNGDTTESAAIKKDAQGEYGRRVDAAIKDLGSRR